MINRTYMIISDDGFIVAVGTGNGSNAITVDMYLRIRNRIKDCPIAPDGYIYRLRLEDLEWVLCEKPPEPPMPEEVQHG